MSGGSADYNRYGALLAVAVCSEGRRAPGEIIVDGMEAKTPT